MPPGGAEGRATPARHARRAPPPRARARGRRRGPRARSPTTDGLDEEARAAVRLAARDRDRALRVPEALVRELSEACSRCVSAWVEARRGRRLRRLRRPPRAGGGAEAARGGGDRDRRRALRRAARRVRAGRHHRRAGAGLRRPARAADAARGPGGRGRAGASCPSGSGTRTARCASRARSPRWWASTSRRGLIAKSAHPFTGGGHRGDVRFTTRTRPDEPAQQHLRRDARAGARPVRAGLPRLRRPHPGPRRAVAGRPRVAVALLGEPDRAHAGVLGAARAGDAARSSPRRWRASTRRCCTARRGWWRRR